MQPQARPRPRMDPLYLVLKFLRDTLGCLAFLVALFLVGWGVVYVLASEQFLIAAFSPSKLAAEPGDPVQSTNQVKVAVVRAGLIT